MARVPFDLHAEPANRNSLPCSSMIAPLRFKSRCNLSYSDLMPYFSPLRSLTSWTSGPIIAIASRVDIWDPMVVEVDAVELPPSCIGVEVLRYRKFPFPAYVLLYLCCLMTLTSRSGQWDGRVVCVPFVRMVQLWTSPSLGARSGATSSPSNDDVWTLAAHTDQEAEKCLGYVVF